MKFFVWLRKAAKRDEAERFPDGRAKGAKGAKGGNQPIECAVVTTERPVWGTNDGVELNRFLKTEAGRKLLGILLYDEQAHNRSAVLRQQGFEYNAGFAAGYGALARQFAPGTPNGFAAIVRPEQDANTTQTDAAALRERLAS